MKISNIQTIKNYTYKKNIQKKQAANQIDYKNINNLNFYLLFWADIVLIYQKLMKI